MKKILFLTASFPPYLTPGSARAARLAAALPAHGWSPVVVAPPLLDFGDGGSTSELLAGTGTLLRTAAPYSLEGFDDARRARCVHGLRIPATGRVGSMLPSLFSAGHPLSGWEEAAKQRASEYLQADHEVAVIYAQGPPAAPLRLALELSLRHGIPVLFDLVSPIDPPAFESVVESLRGDEAAKLEQKILTTGYSLITPTRGLKEFFLKKYFGRVAHDDITIVPTPGEQLSVPQESSDSTELLLFLENGPDKELLPFFSALGRHLRHHPARVVIASGSMQQAERLVQKAGVSEQALVVPLCAHQEAALLIGRASRVGWVSPAASQSAFHLPELALDAALAGKPLFAVAPEGALRQFVRESGGQDAAAGSAEEAGAMLAGFEAEGRGEYSSEALVSISARHEIDAVMVDFVRLLALLLPV